MGPDLYYNVIPSPTFWTGLNIDYYTNLSKSCVESLTDLCLNRLVSNEFHIRHIQSRIPPVLHFLLLKKAILQERILSVIQLINEYPRQSFVIPIPDCLTNWSVFLSKSKNKYFLMRPITSLMPAVMKAFFANSNSQLRSLDLSQVFFPAIMMNDFLSLLPADSSQMNSPSETYTLKTCFISFFDKDRKILCDIKKALMRNKYINFEVDGLHIFSLNSAESAIELFHLMDKEELHHFSLDVSHIDIEKFLPEFQLFHNLQTLSLAYFQNGSSLEPHYWTTLACTLNNFPHLKHLSLRASCVGNFLRMILKYNCDQIYSRTRNNDSSADCCVVHRGKLEYLDVSYCSLKDEDLLVLQEFSFARSLKHINLGHNYFDVTNLADLIGKIGSSLVVLDIEKCFRPDVQLKHLFSKFENLFNLKLLNMKEIRISAEDMTALLKVLEKMPELRKIALSKVDIFSNRFEKLKRKDGLELLLNQAKHDPYDLMLSYRLIQLR